MRFIWVTVAVSAPFLADKHTAKNVPCAACHQNQQNHKKVDEKACFACHGDMEAMAPKTDGKYAQNPHVPHGAHVNCMKCHQGHKPGKNYCAKCHSEIVFNIK